MLALTNPHLRCIMAKTDLTAARLRELLHYDPETGVFTWVVRRGCAQPGDVAGCPDQKGYLKLMIDGKFYYCHRLAWYWVHGVWPVHMIDHIDTVKSHNWIANLRDVPRSINQQNRRTALSNSKTGMLGASPDADGFVARISGVNVGRFKTAQEAHDAYIEAKRRLHPGNML